jgi:serine/threonine protein kinase
VSPEEWYIGPEAEPDKYRIGHPIGAGAEGTLYRGDVRVGDTTSLDVAIKMLHPNHRARLSEWQERWGSQIELLRSLHTPGVVPVRDGFVGPLPHSAEQADTDVLTLYLVMNWIEGEPLDQWALGHGGATPEDRLKLLLSVAAALDLMHSGQATGGTPVIHGDVKPSNILVRSNGDTVLVDFGLIRLLPQGHHSTGVTGTPGYVAPEIRHQGVYTAAADRYALGGVAYFLLCGKEPEAADTIDEARQHLAAHFPDRPELVDHVMAMLDPEPTGRPTILANWCAQLRNSSLDLISEPIRLPPIAPITVSPAAPRVSIIESVDPPDRVARDNKLTIVLPSVVSPAAPGPKLGSGLPPQTRKPAPEKRTTIVAHPEPTKLRPRSSSRRHLVFAVAVSLVLVAGAITFVALRPGSSSALTPQVYTFPPAQLNSGLIVARTWRYDVETRTLSEALVLTNGTTHQLITTYDEVIPASVARTTSSISFSPQPSKVIQPDPVVRYDVALAAGAARTVHYRVTIPGSGPVNVVALGESQLSAQGGYSSASVVAVLRSIYLSPASLHLESGSSSPLAIVGVMSNGTVAQAAVLKTVQWTSSNPSVASIANEWIDAHSAGTAAITARAGHVIGAMSVVVASGSTGSQVQNTGSTGPGSSQPGTPVQSQATSTKAPASTGASGSQSTGSNASGGEGAGGTATNTGSAAGSGTAAGNGATASGSNSSTGTSASTTTTSTTPTAAPSQTPTTSEQVPATYSETTGGVTHTWTNYQNAGGTQGPSIPANATVQIACKLTGFAVADGNTWWYRIASSPWNSSYYASADAFYNDGATSGSLLGTPFVDASVPNC